MARLAETVLDMMRGTTKGTDTAGCPSPATSPGPSRWLSGDPPPLPAIKPVRGMRDKGLIQAGPSGNGRQRMMKRMHKAPPGHPPP